MIENIKTIMNKNYRVFFIYIFLISLGVLNVTIIFLWTRHAKGFKHPHLNNDITCFDVTEGDALPYIDEDLLKRTENIFFLETSCRGYLDSIQACAVESAVREQFDSLIHLVFAGPVNNMTLNTGVLAELKKMNVQIARINMNKALKGTPLERITKENQLHKSKARVAHASDILRLYLLWKYSGIYMDLDVMSLKPFSSLKKDFAGIENPKNKYIIATGVLGLSRSVIGRKMATLLVEEVGKSFDSLVHHWSGIGPTLLTQLLWELCTNAVPYTRMNSKSCEGFEVYDSKVFYPLKAQDYLMYAYGNPQAVNLNDSYAIHMWNRLISTRQSIAPKNSLFDRIANMYCPTVYKLAGDNLGV